MSKLHNSQAFQRHQVLQIPTLYEPMVNLCPKLVVNLFSLYFLMNSYVQPHGKNCPRAEGKGAKKKVVLPTKSWFLLFSNFFGSRLCMLSSSM
jgi:hypothetical protein